MARTYTPERRYSFNDSNDRLDLLRALDTEARKVLATRATPALPLEEAVRITTNEGATVTTKTLAQAEREMREDHLTPQLTLVMFRLGHVGAHTVALSMWDHDSDLTVQFSSEDEGLVQGLATRFDRMTKSTVVPAPKTVPYEINVEPSPAPVEPPEERVARPRWSRTRKAWAVVAAALGVAAAVATIVQTFK